MNGNVGDAFRHPLTSSNIKGYVRPTPVIDEEGNCRVSIGLCLRIYALFLTEPRQLLTTYFCWPVLPGDSIFMHILGFHHTHRAQQFGTFVAHVLRINLVESEYLIAMLKAELACVRNLISEISSGKLAWDLKSVLKEARTSAMAAARPEE